MAAGLRTAMAIAMHQVKPLKCTFPVPVNPFPVPVDLHPVPVNPLPAPVNPFPVPVIHMSLKKSLAFFGIFFWAHLLDVII